MFDTKMVSFVIVFLVVVLLIIGLWYFIGWIITLLFEIFVK